MIFRLMTAGKGTCHIQIGLHQHGEIKLLLQPDFTLDLVTNSGLKWRGEYINQNSGPWDFIKWLNGGEYEAGKKNQDGITSESGMSST